MSDSAPPARPSGCKVLVWSAASWGWTPAAVLERLNAAECWPLKTSVAQLSRYVTQEFEAMGRIVKAARIVGES